MPDGPDPRYLPRILETEGLRPHLQLRRTLGEKELNLEFRTTHLASSRPGRVGYLQEVSWNEKLHSMIVTTYDINDEGFRFRRISVARPSQRQIEEVKVENLDEGDFFGWGPDAQFGHGKRGLSLSFSEKETQEIVTACQAAVGVGTLVTKMTAMAGVTLPAAAAVGLATAVLGLGAILLLAVDKKGTGKGVYAAAGLPFLFWVWYNPVPPSLR